jgi:virginiamycin B lyase
MEMAGFRSLIALIICPILAVGSVFAQDSDTPSPITEFALPESLSAPYAIELDQSSRVWFTEKVGRNLAMFDPVSEQFGVYPLPESWGKVGPSQLAITSGGDIWFTIRRWADDDTQTNVLGRFSPSTESFVRYVISLDASPQEIVADDKGVLWLLASDKNQLFRVDPVDAKVTGYEIPTPNANPQGLVIGHNGDVWFSEPNANQIGRFSTIDGLFDEYKIPTAFSNPGDIALDAEGKVWFVERASNRLGVLYPDLNRFDEALVPTVNALPHAIEVDSRNRLWFLEYRGNKVGVFNPIMATFHEFDIPSYNSFPGEMVYDPATERLWFTESNAETSQLGMLSIDLAGLPSASDPATNGLIEAAGEAGTAARWTEFDHSTLYIVLGLAAVLLGTGVWATHKPREAA